MALIAMGILMFLMARPVTNSPAVFPDPNVVVPVDVRVQFSPEFGG